MPHSKAKISLTIAFESLVTLPNRMYVGIIQESRKWHTQHCAAISASAELLFVLRWVLHLRILILFTLTSSALLQCYFTGRDTCDQRHFAVSEVAAERQEIMALYLQWPLTVHAETVWLAVQLAYIPPPCQPHQACTP